MATNDQPNWGKKSRPDTDSCKLAASRHVWTTDHLQQQSVVIPTAADCGLQVHRVTTRTCSAITRCENSSGPLPAELAINTAHYQVEFIQTLRRSIDGDELCPLSFGSVSIRSTVGPHTADDSTASGGGDSVRICGRPRHPISSDPKVNVWSFSRPIDWCLSGRNRADRKPCARVSTSNFSFISFTKKKIQNKNLLFNWKKNCISMTRTQQGGANNSKKKKSWLIFLC